MYRFCVLVLLVVLLQAGAAIAGGRVALVVGNGKYGSMGELPTPTKDARAIVELLKNKLGFEVIPVLDGDHAGMRQALTHFGRAATGADVALFYYAGHGIELDGANYLLPISADIRTVVDLESEAFRLDRVIDILVRSGAKTKVFFIDACRDNPLPGARTRGAKPIGLAPSYVTNIDMLIAFAAAPGKKAIDDAGRGHSPFTAALLENLATPGLEILSMLRKVRASVYRATREEQFPWVDDFFLDDVYLAGAPVHSVNPASSTHLETADFASADDGGASSIKTRSPGKFYSVSSYWTHNGSVMALSANGKSRVFYYEDPRAGIADAGVGAGTLLFKGEVNGMTYSGMAYLFSKNCSPVAYRVSGVVSADYRRVELTGRKPVRGKNCKQISSARDTLVFEFLSKE